MRKDLRLENKVKFFPQLFSYGTYKHGGELLLLLMKILQQRRCGDAHLVHACLKALPSLITPVLEELALGGGSVQFPRNVEAAF